MKKLAIFVVSVSLLIMSLQLISAHCDTLDGPVISAAKKSLTTGNINYTLIWVMPEHEQEIKTSFQKALGSSDFETTFFEDLVRLHREGEGALYTGLKPTGTLDPKISAADEAIIKSSLEPLAPYLTPETEDGVHERLHEVLQKKNFEVNNLSAGRDFVDAYVRYMHFVEGEEEHVHNHESETTQHSEILNLPWALSVIFAISTIFFAVAYFKK
jgi:hypothetical protein